MDKIKTVILDSYTDDARKLDWTWLSKYGEYKVYARTPQTDNQIIIKYIGAADIAIANKAHFSKEVIDGCPNLKFISVIGTGYNIVDIDYAHKKGVVVSNEPGYSTMPTSQHAIALMLELTNNVSLHNNAVHQGNWVESQYYNYYEKSTIELTDKIMGIIGFGNIGKQTAKTAKALGMNVIVNTPHPDEEWNGFVDFCDLDYLFKNSDVVVLHCVLNKHTKEIINKSNIEKMKNSAIIVNDGRGGLINEQDLCDALNSNRIAGAAVDVVSVEPIQNNNPLLKAKNCIITPHIAWSSKDSRRRIMQITEENVKAFIEGNPINVV